MTRPPGHVVDELENIESILADWLSSRCWIDEDTVLGPVTISDVAKPAAGQSNDTILFDMARPGPAGPSSTRLVLRRQARSPQIFKRPDVLREAMVLRGLWNGPVPVPRVLWTESDPVVLGAPFFVMECVPGRVPLGKPSIHQVGLLPSLSVSERRRLWDSAMDALVAVHATPWEQAHSFLLRPGGVEESTHGSTVVPDLTGYLAGLLDWYRWTTDGRSFPITDAAASHLQRVVGGLPSTDTVLVWGDARVGNMIFGADNTVSAVIDWELATIGPPELDLARWIFFDAFGTSAVGIARLDGWPDRAETISQYEHRSGRRLRDLGFYELLDELFMATTLIRQSDLRVARGLAEADTTMGHANTVTQMIARRLGLEVPGLSPDYLAHRDPNATKNPQR